MGEEATDVHLSQHVPENVQLPSDWIVPHDCL